MNTPAPYQLLDGKKVSNEIKEEIAAEVSENISSGKWHRKPNLATVLVGEDPASHSYVKSKIKACAKVGFNSTHIELEETVTEADLIQTIISLNEDPNVDGILVQLPLPKHISESLVIETISAAKDVDGFHPINIGRIAKNLPAPPPATPAGIMELLKRYDITTKGKEAVVVGRSNIVGTPVSILLSRSARTGNCTVTLTHRHTPNLIDHTRRADILVVAVGIPDLITADMVKPGCVLIDVGINRIDDATKKRGYRLVGDVDFENVAPLCSYITPVPGGVGPMTIAMLLKNTLEVYKSRLKEKVHS